MKKEPTRDVRLLYEAHPYPSPVAGDGLIRDVANMAALVFPPGFLEGKTILDAGCGTGHRLLGFAKQFPRSDFLGVDMTGASLNTARKLAERHNVRNVRFQQANLLELNLAAEFDLVVSTGVINCLENPDGGLANLRRHLAPGGHIVLWHYHAYGEFDRLLDRELLLTFWDRESMSLSEGIEIMQSLGISLSRERYSSAYAARDNQVMDEVSMNVDAYLHPIVHAYRFDEALDMLGRCGMDWAAVHNVNVGNDSKLIDLDQVSETSMRMFCLKNSQLFKSASVEERYRRLGNRGKLKVIELLTKPNGFNLISGTGDTYRLFDKRIQGGRVSLQPA
jgi:ubiquinone/menaquinone biosynthesis C-methylase UbiE